MTIQQWLGPNGLLFYTEDEEGKANVFWGGRIYYSFNRSDMLAKRFAIPMWCGLTENDNCIPINHSFGLDLRLNWGIRKEILWLKKM